MKEEKTITTMSHLIQDLSQAYSELRKGNLSLDIAKETANLSGKLIKAACAQLKYNEFLQLKEEIEFFKTPVK